MLNSFHCIKGMLNQIKCVKEDAGDTALNDYNINKN